MTYRFAQTGLASALATAFMFWQSALSMAEPDAIAAEVTRANEEQPSSFLPASVMDNDLFKSPPMHNACRNACSNAQTPGDVIYESIFGDASPKKWKPLTLTEFFSAGWNDPFVNAPEGTNGAPKQFWALAPSGVFSRLMHADVFYTNGLQDNPGLFLNGEPWSPVHPKHTTGNQYTAAYAIFIPFNSRFEVQIIAPFISSNRLDTSGPYQGNFGDLSFQFRFHLIERRNFSLVAFLGERTPTGNFVNGNNINYLTPSLEGWWNFAYKWVARGATGINVRTSHTDSIADVYFNRLSIGRYITDKNAPFFKDTALYGIVTVLNDVGGQANYVTDVYVGPGIRFGVGKQQKGAFSFAVETPVSGPRTYIWQPNASFILKY